MHQHRYRLPYRARTVAGLPALAMVAAACGGKGEPSVSVKGLDADVVFGVKTKAGTQAPGGGPMPEEVGFDEEIALIPDQGDNRRRSFRQQVQPTEACPEARINAFPKEPASEQVSRQPAPGLYRWKRGGFTALNSLQGQQQKIAGFEERLVENVTVVSESENPTTDYKDKRNTVFTYETVQPYGDGTVRTTYRVKTNAEVQREAKPFTGNPRVRAGDPERGLSIIREVYEDRQGGVEEREFAPGLLLLPLPISSGESFTSVSEVSREGPVRYNGTVQVKERIDACGEIVEGYRVKGTLIRESLTTEYNFLVGTQLGALLIQETSKYTDEVGVNELHYELGQLQPTPPPPQEQQ